MFPFWMTFIIFCLEGSSATGIGSHGMINISERMCSHSRREPLRDVHSCDADKTPTDEFRVYWRLMDVGSCP